MLSSETSNEGDFLLSCSEMREILLSKHEILLSNEGHVFMRLVPVVTFNLLRQFNDLPFGLMDSRFYLIHIHGDEH